MEDLLDLDFAATAGTQRKAQRTTFDYLSSARTHSPANSSRAASPLPPAPATLPRPISRSSTPNQSQTTAQSDSDAFSSLFGASPASSNGTGTTLSMQDRLSRDKHAASSQSGGNWNSLQPTITPRSNSTSPKPPSVAAQFKATPDPWNFDLLAPTPVHPTPIATRAPSPLQRSQTPLSLFDSPTTSRQDDDDEFDDFGLHTTTRKVGAIKLDSTNYAENSSDDILGLLSQPFDSKMVQRPAPPPISRPSNGRSSPPPHVLGQIVEMGFSVEQGRSALISSMRPNGEWSVESAMEILVGQQSSAPEPQVERRRDTRRDDRRGVEELPARPTGRRAREAAALAAASRSNEEPTEAGPSAYQEQATVLLSQASKLGFSVFKSANAYYKTGRATIQKALDEGMSDQSDGGLSRRGSERDGSEKSRGGEAKKARPKWMTDDVVDDEEVVASSSSRVEDRKSERKSERSNGKQVERQEPSLLFQDSDPETAEDFVMPQRPVERKAKPVETRSSRPDPPVAQEFYSSPWRRPKPTPQSSASSSIPSTSSPVSRSTTTTSIPKTSPPIRTKPTPAPRPPIPTRPVVTATSIQLSKSLAHKTKGNDLFKLGHFGESINHYTLALDVLPADHLSTIPLLNNRAAARLKVGEEKSAIEDSTEVVRIVTGSASEPVDFARIPDDAEGGVGGKEGLAKALARRAKAFEVEEKWEKASADWAALMAGGDTVCAKAGGRKLVSEGAARCRKMMGGGNDARPAPPVATKPARLATSSTPRSAPKPIATTGEAVARLREANTVASEEDDLRFSLQDSVDGLIGAWKKGKESNLRALIASLDNVLWAELGWVKVGMHELISESQLKVRYVRAIGKLHPDKLSPGTSVEHRMIAGLVFSALNDAWSASR